MTASRSLLIVNYRSADLTRRAIASARASSTIPLFAVVVDNTADRDEMKMLETVGADRLLRAPRNLGFAGGINFGIRESQGDIVIATNPDVEFHGRVIDQLSDRINDQVALSGPKVTWDEAGQWLLPPVDAHRPRSRVLEAWATRSSAWNRMRSAARLRRRIRFWSLTEPTPVKAVSGAVMCVRRDVMEGLGGFDERFALYFEEVDFMKRLRRAGFTIEYCPAARCRHLYNQSAAQEPTAATRYLESEREFHRKWAGSWFVSLMERIAVKNPSDGSFEPLPEDACIRVEEPERVLIEASPQSSFDVAAGHFPVSSSVTFPADVWSSYRGRTLFLRLLDRHTGAVSAQFRLDKTQN